MVLLSTLVGRWSTYYTLLTYPTFQEKGFSQTRVYRCAIERPKGKISKEKNVEEEKCRKINTERGKCQKIENIEIRMSLINNGFCLLRFVVFFWFIYWSCTITSSNGDQQYHITKNCNSHNNINSIVQLNHPNIRSFIKFLQGEESVFIICIFNSMQV
jgi:hypothetical protein